MTFNDAIDFVFLHEGGYVNDPNDPGGETQWGISKRAYPNVDIKGLTKRKAKHIYKRDYWVKSRCQDLPSELRLLHLDTAVNMGVGRAIKLLQKSLSVKVDGDFGPKTLAAATSSPTDVVVDRYCRFRHSIYARNKNWKHYGKGWSKRLLEVSILSALMVEKSSVEIPLA